MHLGGADAAHLLDGALELALQCPPVVDALREVRHAPRRIVEELKALSVVRRDPGPGERDPRPRCVTRANHDLCTTGAELRLDIRVQ
jgi:hypothetical protein